MPFRAQGSGFTEFGKPGSRFMIPKNKRQAATLMVHVPNNWVLRDLGVWGLGVRVRGFRGLGLRV